MTVAHNPRWLMSFADLTLLLLAFFVLLHARADGGAAAASVRQAFGGASAASPAERFPAADLFLPGEAVMRPAAAYQLRGLGARLAAAHRRARISSEGRTSATSRLDAWEIGAARSAAIARALGSGGMPADAIGIALPDASMPAKGPQIFTVEGASRG